MNDLQNSVSLAEFVSNQCSPKVERSVRIAELDTCYPYKMLIKNVGDLGRPPALWFEKPALKKSYWF
jgi:hypothetical protein